MPRRKVGTQISSIDAGQAILKKKPRICSTTNAAALSEEFTLQAHGRGEMLESMVDLSNVVCEPCEVDQQESEVYHCNLCGGESESMGWNGIMDHMRTHMATTNICCDVVGYGYDRFQEARAHTPTCMLHTWTGAALQLYSSRVWLLHIK